MQNFFLPLEGLIAGLIFLNISLWGMLFVTRDIDHACYVDGNAPDVAADSIKDIIRNGKMIQSSYSNGFLITSKGK